MNSGVSLLQVDFNLLPALDALIEHQSVQEAAAVLHLTPPAMSHALRRLRQATGDDVLVRNGRSMVATPRALQMQDEVRELVSRAQAVLSPPVSLDLSTLHRSFTISGNEALIAALAPPLLAEIADAAPWVSLTFLGEQPVDAQELIRGTVDLEVAGARATSSSIRSRTVGEDLLAVVMRPDHPMAACEKLDIGDFAAASHVVVSRRGRLHGPIDVLLAAQGLHRRVIASLPSAAVAVNVVRRSSAITVLAGRSVPDTDSVARRALPLELPPLPAVVSWHRRHDSDPAHRWLRTNASTLLSNILSPLPRIAGSR